MDKYKFDIDLVYLWVDGNDVEWLSKKNKFLGKSNDYNIEATTIARNANNDELKYSLRSVEKNIPWVRKIFIVTDEQKPEWLNLENPKIQIVDIREILPAEALPCYNSVVIECFLYKIPDLSEHFLYANDDMFFNIPLLPNFFFGENGFPYIYQIQKPFTRLRNWWKFLSKKELTMYRRTILNAADLVNERFKLFNMGLPFHNVDAYLKSDYKDVVEKVFSREIEALTNHHVRQMNDIQRVLFSYYLLAIKHGHQRKNSKTISCVIDLYKSNYNKFLNSEMPALFCLNDSQYVNSLDRNRVKVFLQNYFPKKSNFEI